MHKIPARTLFTGKSLIYVPSCHSTNTLASRMAQQPDTPDGTVVITDDQTAGRGQRGNSWEAAPGKNLTFSLILKPGFLQAKDQFQLSQAVALGLAAYVAQYVPQRVMIKWPNDIIIAGKKVAGILIENHLTGELIGHSVVGIGLNLNQELFQAAHAASLAIFTGRHFDLTVELEELLLRIEEHYLRLSEGKAIEINQNYRDRLFGLNERRRFRDKVSEFEGTIEGTTDQGELCVNAGKGLRTFGVKEIQFL